MIRTIDQIAYKIVNTALTKSHRTAQYTDQYHEPISIEVAVVLQSLKSKGCFDADAVTSEVKGIGHFPDDFAKKIKRIFTEMEHLLHCLKCYFLYFSIGSSH